MFRHVSRGFILLLGVLLLHCADTTKHQAEYRGSWVLEARTTPQGQEIMSPEISGVMEWFPMSETQAHVLITISSEKETVQAFEGIYQLNGNVFSAKANLLIGGMLGTPPDATYETTGKDISGQIQSEDARVTLVHTNGTKFEFIGAQLSVSYENGTVDRWKRLRDQKGTLLN